VIVYELRQDWNSAKSVAAELATQFPTDPGVLEAQGRAQFGADDPSGAISSYERAHELVPNSLPILARYLALLNAEKYYSEALRMLEEAVARNPRNTALKADLIRVEAEIDGVDAAASKAREMAKDDPANNIFDLLSEELYEKAGRGPDAVAVLEKAVAAKPSDDNLATALARLYSRIGEPAKAEEALTRRLNADPKDATIVAALASLYNTSGHTKKAKRAYSDLLSQQPTNVTALLGLAQIAAGERKWTEAKDYILRARAGASNDPAPGIALVNLYGLLKDWKNATTTATELADQFPTNTDVLDAKARVEAASGNRAAAVATYRRLHTLAPNSAPALSRYLALLNETKNYAEARTVLETALTNDPKNLALKSDLIRTEAATGGLDAGLAKARAFAEKDTGNPVYDAVSAELYEKAGRVGEAVSLLETAVAERPAADGLIAALSRLYARTGALEKAERILTTRLRVEPKDPLIRSALAALYLEEKRYDDAITEYTRLVSENSTDAAALNNLAWLYQQKGDLAKARSLAERAVTAAPSAPLIDDTLGWILLAQGEADKAVAYLSAANFSAPANPDIQYHLAVAFHRAGRQNDAQATLEALLGSGVSFAEKPDAEKLLEELKRG